MRGGWAVEKAVGHVGYSAGYFIHISAKICRAAVRWSTAHIGHPVGGVSRRAAFKITDVARFPNGRNSSVMRRRHHHIGTHDVFMLKLLAALTGGTGLMALAAAAVL